MNIWILNHYALTPDMSGGTRHYDFAKELIKRGHKVTIAASSFHYSKYQEMKEYGDKEYIEEIIEGIRFVWIKTPPYFTNGYGRVKNMLSYTLRVLRILPKLNLSNPDVVIGSSVHLFAVFAAMKLAQKYKTPFIMEVRDLWPQTLIDMGISKRHPFIVLLGRLERYLYKKADKIISNLPYAYDYIGAFAEKEKFIWISNGVDLSNIKYTPKQKSEKFIVSYTGSIGAANELRTLLDAAKKLRYKKEIHFRIVGEGAEKEKLQKFVKNNSLQNVSIENSVPKKEISKILEKSDLLFLGLKDIPLYKFGTSLNKLFDYMASGRVILFAGRSKNNPILEAQAGYTIEPDNAELLQGTILEIYALSQEQRVKIGEKTRRYVATNYSIEILVDKLEETLKEKVEKLYV